MSANVKEEKLLLKTYTDITGIPDFLITINFQMK